MGGLKGDLEGDGGWATVAGSEWAREGTDEESDGCCLTILGW